MRELATVPAGKYVVRLRSVGNPDKGQYAPVSNPGTFIGDSVEACAEACLAYIEKWNLGGGNWPTAPVKKDGKVVAWISYNGRIWTPAEHEKRQADTRAIFHREDDGARFAKMVDGMIEADATDEEIENAVTGFERGAKAAKRIGGAR